MKSIFVVARGDGRWELEMSSLGGHPPVPHKTFSTAVEATRYAHQVARQIGADDVVGADLPEDEAQSS